MGILKIVGILYLSIGFIYALYLWLFKSETFLDIIVNTLLGPIYILLVIFQVWNYKKTTINELFLNKKAVIFDLDGTLIDSQEAWEKSLLNVAEKLNLTDFELEFIPGLNIAEKWETLLSENNFRVGVPISKLVEQTKQEFLTIFNDFEFTNGFEVFVTYLKGNGYKVGLATNTDTDVVTSILSRGDASNAFDEVIAGDQVSKHKPNPEIFKKMIKKLGVKTSEVIVFEDSVVGAQAAKSAGLDVIVVWNGDVPIIDYPRGIKFYIEDFEDMVYDITQDRKAQLKDMGERMIEYDLEI